LALQTHENTYTKLGLNFAYLGKYSNKREHKDYREMSTYTDLHNRIKENLTILRKPGSKDDGMSPQKVILVNPEN
jgi:hypothetical protein